VAEFCRNVHEDIEFKESAENVFHKLSHITNELNTDEDVYQKLKNISESDRNKLNGNNVCFIDNLIPNI
jgi:Zn-dependent oligopeptidase